MSLNLSSGYVPELNKVKHGKITKVDWSRSLFGHYTYSVLVDALSSEQDEDHKLEEVLLSTFSLSKISPILCFQLGHTFKQNGCNVKFIKQGVRETWLEFDDDNTGEVEWEHFEEKCKEFFAEHPDENIEKAITCAKKHIKSENTVYYSDFVNLIQIQEFLSMLVIGNPTLEAVKTGFLDDPGAERLLEFMDGLDKMSMEDPKSGITALYYAFEKAMEAMHEEGEVDETLIKELQDRGAKTGETDGQKLGEIACDMMKTTKEAKASKELSVMRHTVKELEKFFEVIYKYDCIDWDPALWSDDEGNNLMHYCAMDGTKDIAKVLLSVPRLDSECLPSPNENNKTPLLCANDKEIIELFQANLHEYEHINDQRFTVGMASDVAKYYTQQPQSQYYTTQPITQTLPPMPPMQ